jgi:hypothetical protein
MSQMCPTRWLSYVATWSADGSSIIKSRQIEEERLKRIEQAPCDGPQVMVRELARAMGSA